MSVTFRRDTMVDVADPDVPSGVAAGEGGAAPPEVPEVPSGVLTRSQQECTDAAAAGDVTRLKRAHENGCPMFGADRYDEIMQVYENMQLDGDGADAMRSYLESIRGSIGCPIESVMAKLDEVKTNIPEQTYIEMSNELMRAHREKKRRRPNQ